MNTNFYKYAFFLFFLLFLFVIFIGITRFDCVSCGVSVGYKIDSLIGALVMNYLIAPVISCEFPIGMRCGPGKNIIPLDVLLMSGFFGLMWFKKSKKAK